MWRERLREYLLPGAAERDPAFRQEILRLSTLALKVIGGAQIAVSLFMLLARFLIAPESATLPYRLRQGAWIAGMGALNLVAAQFKPLQRLARLIAAVSGLVVASVLIWASLVIRSQSTNPNDFIPGQITLVMLVAITVVPLRPMHTLLLGLCIGVIYAVATTIAERSLLEGLGPDSNYLLFILMLSLLSTGITSVVYAQRYASYRNLQEGLAAADNLRQAQLRILLSENAASLSRLAAAISHEMNTPLGALISGVDTLLLLAARQATTSSEADQQRLVRLQAEIRRSVQESAQRLRDLVTRMQRFTNLDQADVQAADINELLKDVAALLDPETRKRAELKLELQPVPPVVCRPQQLSAVFSSLVSNAFKAVNGTGCVVISTREQAGGLEVEIADNGRGLSRAEIEGIFDPGFKVAGGRMSTGNWSMFNSRQIVRELGGDISIASTPGHGTQVTVKLPLQPAGEGMALS